MLTRNAPLLLVGAGAGCVVLAALLLNWLGLHQPNWIISTDRDFANYWIASRLILSGDVLDLFRGHEVYFAQMQAVFGPDAPWRSWSYPPSYLLLMWPLGLMPYSLSLAVFLVVTLIVYLHAVSVAAGRVEANVALFLVPFICANIIYAQNGFIIGALILYGLGLRDSRPWLAGFAIGLLTIKPQLGLLLPLLLLYERRWIVILSASITAAALVLISSLVFGIEAWTGYITETIPYQAFVMRELGGSFLQLLLSLYGALRLEGVDAAVALPIHIGFAIVVLAAYGLSLFLAPDKDARSLCLVIASLLITPYSLSYDLGALSALAALWAWRLRRPTSSMGPQQLLFYLIAMLPLLQWSLAANLGLSVTPILLSIGLGLLLFEFRTRQSASPST
ncbi:glycosyltransferase family 87 protein [Hoeflea sp.]|uniref:glycosyltransferase family 87 protein n=1 Tax=Hoeflea sp. TaxID=1940281 RepID=UPI003A94D6AE